MSTTGPAYTGSGDLLVGTGSLGSQGVLVDDIYLFTRTLSASDISDISSSSNTFDRSSLVFLHRLQHQEPWAWDEGYATNGYAFAATTSVFTDPADRGHALTAVGSFQLEVGSLAHLFGRCL